MDHNEFPLLLNAEQVSRLVGFKRSKNYELMREKNHPFPAQACRGRRPLPRSSTPGLRAYMCLCPHRHCALRLVLHGPPTFRRARPRRWSSPGLHLMRGARAPDRR